MGAPEAQSKPFGLREKLGVGGSLPIVWCYTRDGIHSKSVSQHFLPNFHVAFFHLVCRHYWLVSVFLPDVHSVGLSEEGNSSMTVYYLFDMF